MTKKNALKKQDDDLIDFENMLYEESYDEDTMLGIMGSMLEASNNQMMMAIELTKLIVANDPVKKSEDQVFSTFRKATKVIGENFALKNIMEQVDR